MVIRLTKDEREVILLDLVGETMRVKMESGGYRGKLVNVRWVKAKRRFLLDLIQEGGPRSRRYAYDRHIPRIQTIYKKARDKKRQTQ